MRRTWTEDEEEYLCENFPEGDLQEMSRTLKRSIGTIRAAAQRRGLNRKSYANGEGKKAPINTHLCWYCKHSLDKPIGYCSWANDLTPVKGWGIKKRKSGRFVVISCPLYERG